MKLTKVFAAALTLWLVAGCVDLGKGLADLDPNMATREADQTERWISADEAPLRLSGLAFRQAGGGFERVPQKGLPPGVMGLGVCTAGVQLAFKTDSSKICVRVTLEHPMRMDHMAQTGSCGFDLYCGAPGHRRYFGCARFKLDENNAFTAEIVGKLPREMREYVLDFPLYSGVKKFELGLDPDAKIAAPTAWNDDRPIVWYGTSITQGGCATRPGMCTTNILSRKWNLPILNFGFSGSGKGEHVVAEMLAGIADPAMYVLDYEPNAGFSGMQKTLDDVIDTLRAKHPATPIVVLSRTPYSRDLYGATDPADCRKFQKETVERRRQAGDHAIYFINGAPDIPGADEWTVDGIHLTDLGFVQQSAYLAPLLKKILKESK